jgi:hypothetical protein
MYSVQFIRRVPGFTVPEVLIGLEPPTPTFSTAFASGKRAFAVRGADAPADGFRIIEHKTLEPHYWYPDDPDHLLTENGTWLPVPTA